MKVNQIFFFRVDGRSSEQETTGADQSSTSKLLEYNLQK